MKWGNIFPHLRKTIRFQYQNHFVSIRLRPDQNTLKITSLSRYVRLYLLHFSSSHPYCSSKVYFTITTILSAFRDVCHCYHFINNNAVPFVIISQRNRFSNTMGFPLFLSHCSINIKHECKSKCALTINIEQNGLLC